MANKLQQEHPNYQVVNVSVSGQTTTEALEVLVEQIKKYQPEIVILGLGSNDGLRGTTITLIKGNLEKMVVLCQQNHAKILLVGFLLPTNYGPKYRKSFEEVFINVSYKFQILRVPFLLEGVALKTQLMQSDGLHPNAKAQPVILNLVWPYLKKLLNNK